MSDQFPPETGESGDPAADQDPADASTGAVSDGAASSVDVRHEIEQIRRRLVDLTPRNPLLDYRFADHIRGQIRLVGDGLDDIFAGLSGGLPLPVTGPDVENGAQADDNDDARFLALEAARIDDEAFRADIRFLDGADPDNPAFALAERALQDRVSLQLGRTVPAESGPIVSRAARARAQSLPDSYDLPRPAPVDPAAAEPILAYGLQTLLTPTERRRRHGELLALEADGRDRTGRSPLHVAYGLLRWHGETTTPHLAPLLFQPFRPLPAADPVAGPWQVAGVPNAVRVNPVLRHVLREQNIDLPDWSEEDTPESYLQRVTRAVEPRANWQVRRSCFLAAFDLLSADLWADLDAARWPDAAVGAAGALLGAGPSSDEDAAPKPFTAKTALDIAKDRRGLVVETPPGTAPSDALREVVLEAFDRRAQMLVVAQRDVPLERLLAALRLTPGEEDFTPFVLDLRDRTTRENDILGAIRRRLSLPRGGASPGSTEGITAELADIDRTLEALAAPFGATGMRPGDIRLAEEKVRTLSLPAEFDPVDLPQADHLDAEGRERCRIALSDLEAAWQALAAEGGDGGPSPWTRLGTPIDPGTFPDIRSGLQHWHGALEDLDAAVAALAEKTGWPRPETIEEVDALIQGLPEPRTLRALQADSSLALILPVLADPATENAARRLHGLWKQVDAIDADLGRTFGNIDKVATRADDVNLLVTAWRRTNRTDVSLANLREVMPEHQAEGDALAQARGFIAGICDPIDLPSPDGPEDFQLLEEAAAIITGTPPVCLEADHMTLLSEDGTALLDNLAQDVRSLRSRKRSLERHIRVTTKLSPALLRRAARDLQKTPFLMRPFSRRYGKARRLLDRLKRPKTKLRTAPMLLRAMADFAESALQFRDREVPRAILGPVFQGMSTDMAEIDATLTYGEKARALAERGDFGKALAEALLKAPGEMLYDFAERVTGPDLERIHAIRDRLIADGEPSLSELASRFSGDQDAYDHILALANALGLDSDIRFQQLDDAVSRLRQRAGLMTGELAALAPSAKALEEAGFTQGNPARRQSALNLLDALNPPGALRNKAGAQRWRETFLTAPALKDLPSLDSDRAQIAALLKAVRAGAQRLSDALGQPVTGLAAADPDRPPSLRETAHWTTRAASVDPSRLQAVAETRARAEEAGLGALVSACEASGRTRDLGMVFDKVYWRSLAKRLRNHPDLGGEKGPDGKALATRRDALRADLRRHRDLSLRQALLKRAIPAGKMGDVPESSVEGALLTQLGEFRPRLATLLARAPRALRTLMPCWLVTPGELGTLPDKTLKGFDLVVLDEAGQMDLAAGMAAALRARTVLVAGDSRQAPPPSRPLPVLDWTQDPGDGETIRVSVLDRGLGAFADRLILTEIRETADPSLLDFANRRFYQNRLTHAVPERLPDGGLRIHPVDGFGTGRLNAAEARAIFAAARDHMRARPDLSLGIATATPGQAALIGMLIDRARKSDPAVAGFLERWKDVPERFAVKALDSLQGDRWDAVLISLVFAPPKPGWPVPQRFGLFSGPAGARHLNTLATRARLRLDLFTALSPDDIGRADHAPAGVVALTDYLDHVRHYGEVVGRQGPPAPAPVDHDDMDGPAVDAERPPG